MHSETDEVRKLVDVQLVIQIISYWTTFPQNADLSGTIALASRLLEIFRLVLAILAL